MKKIPAKTTLLIFLSILPFSIWAQEVSKEEMKDYFKSEAMCLEYEVMDVPEIAPMFLKSDSLSQLYNKMYEQARVTPEDELGDLETKLNDVLYKHERLQIKLYETHINHCKKLLNQSGLNLTWSRVLSIREMNNEETLKLQDEILLEDFNARISAPENIIEGMDDDAFQNHLIHYVKYVRGQMEVQKLSEAASRGEGSEREAFKRRTELADHYQSLFDDGTLNEEQFALLDQKANSDFMLKKLVEALVLGRIGFAE